MRRILFTTSVFKEALLLKKKSVIQALHDCLKSEDLEGWILANTTESLLKLGIAKNTILKNLQGFSEIPINARLNNAALTFPINGLLRKSPFDRNLSSGNNFNNI